MNSSYISPRAQALIALGRVLDGGQTLDEAALQWRMNDNDRSFVRLLLLETLRHRGQIDALLAKYIDKPLPPKRAEVMHALRLGVAQLLLLNTPSHAAVNEIVALLKGGKHNALTGMANAVLKKIAADQPVLGDTNLNLPSWLWDRWKPCYGSAG